MSKESDSTTPQTAEPPTVIDASLTTENQKIGKEDAMEFLNEIQENAGQISELKMEEENIVNEYLSCLLTIIKPFSKTLEISVNSLPEKYNQRISRAYLHITGQMALVYKNGEVEILNLANQENHKLLVDITGEIMLKLRSVINSYKSETENRVKFLISVTKELQKVAKVFLDE